MRASGGAYAAAAVQQHPVVVKAAPPAPVVPAVVQQAPVRTSVKSAVDSGEPCAAASAAAQTHGAAAVGADAARAPQRSPRRRSQRWPRRPRRPARGGPDATSETDADAGCNPQQGYEPTLCPTPTPTEVAKDTKLAGSLTQESGSDVRSDARRVEDLEAQEVEQAGRLDQ
jgi:hypothetical protein